MNINVNKSYPMNISKIKKIFVNYAISELNYTGSAGQTESVSDGVLQD